jgi:hypothetical protein
MRHGNKTATGPERACGFASAGRNTDVRHPVGLGPLQRHGREGAAQVQNGQSIVSGKDWRERPAAVRTPGRRIFPPLIHIRCATVHEPLRKIFLVRSASMAPTFTTRCTENPINMGLSAQAEAAIFSLFTSDPRMGLVRRRGLAGKNGRASGKISAFRPRRSTTS